MNNNVAALNIQTTVATIVAQILHPRPAVAGTAPVAGQSPNGSSPAPTGSGGIILTPLFPQTDRPVPMDINLNQLLNSATLKSPLSQLPAELLARPQVIEAIVLRNTLLPSTPNQPQTTNPLLTALAGEPTLELPTSYRVSLQWQNRVLQFISPLPLPAGRTVQLQINARGEVLLLPPATQAKIAAPLLAGQTLQTPSPQSSSTQSPSTQTQAGLQTSAARAMSATQALQNTAAQLPTTPIKLTPQQTLQQSLREVLPRQEALHTLMPLLQKLIAPNVAAPLPAPIAKLLGQLLQSLPKPAQLQTGDGVKRAIENSGSFLESRIGKSSGVTTGAGATPEPLPKVLESDLKAQLTALLGAVRRLLPNGAAVAQATNADPSQATQADELIYSPKLLLRNNSAPAARDDDVDAGDLQLIQLSKLLQSGLARIQLNQLDGAVSRHANADPQLQVPAWVLELPLQNTRGHSDNLQVRIEQRDGQQQSRTRVQWNVQIAFDLHELGKIAATLSIVDKNVAATVWAEQASTHRSVQQKIDYLRAGLESVGVKVTEMQCRLGLPPPRTTLISQQLVDVHT